MAQSSSDANPLARHGGLSYLEIPAVDPRQSAEFYAHVLGWHVDQREGDDFRFFDGNGLFIGRWASDRVASPDPGLLLFMYVDSIDVAVERVTQKGGEIVKAPYSEGDVLVARIRDPAGNLLGLWQFKK
jgi:predicted enzyme related to lactoylglutathione lyase